MRSMKIEVIPERFKRAKEQINTEYRIVDLAKNFGIKLAPSGQHMVCPFHDDSTPSLAIDYERNIFNCFGCGAGGSYVNFYTACEKKFKDRNIYSSTAVEEILKADPALQHQLGFTSIYDSYEQSFSIFTEENVINEELLKREQPKLVDTIGMKHTLDKVKKADTATKLEFIADCEQGMSVEFLIKKYYYGQRVEEFKLAIPDTPELTAAFADIFNDD